MKKKLRLVNLGSVPAGGRLWFAKGSLCGVAATVIFQKTKVKICTCWHLGHEYDQFANRKISQVWRKVWVEVME